MTCLHGSTYAMQVTDRFGNQVNYPSPARQYGLGEQHIPMSDFDNEYYDFSSVDSPHFHYAYTKNLSTKNATTPFLV